MTILSRLKLLSLGVLSGLVLTYLYQLWIAEQTTVFQPAFTLDVKNYQALRTCETTAMQKSETERVYFIHCGGVL